jgi:hypothetical protein
MGVTCCNYNGVTCPRCENPSILDRKIDGDIISAFSHNTDTTYEKIKIDGAKNKVVITKNKIEE